MRIAIMQNGAGLLGEDEKPLVFISFREALKYLAERNYTLEEILQIDFEREELQDD